MSQGFPTQSEALIQEAFLVWLHVKHRHIYDFIYHIPNGGHRLPAVAAKLKKQGVKAGVPDLFLPIPVKGYAGLYLELKCGHNSITEAQAERMYNYASVGYACRICHTVEEAIHVMEAYLGLQQGEISYVRHPSVSRTHCAARFRFDQPL